jgi:hypothetical protein
MLNRSVFNVPISLVTNEKAPNAVFVDALNGLEPDRELLRSFVDESKMGKSQLLYFNRQFERNILSEKGAALLVIDPYSEMNFQLWRHSDMGWRFWVPKGAIRELAAFQKTFVSDGYRRVEESIEDTARVLNHIRGNNPGMPVLFLPQLLTHYPSLSKRHDFNEMGSELAKEIPSLFVGASMAKDVVVPEDLGTGGGPNLTLHFSKDTYWRCAQPAVDAGLLEEVASVHKSVLADSRFISAIDGEAYCLSLREDSQQCIDTCKTLTRAVAKNLQQYFVYDNEQIERSAPVKFRSAILDLEKFRDYTEYEQVVKKSGKGARIRQRNKSAKLGYYCKPFHWRMHIPDIYDINHSAEVRSGGQMRSTYLRSVDEMGGAPQRAYIPAIPKCPLHWVFPWGVFQKDDGHMQGTIQTDERLVGYIFLRRFGDFLLYSQILGHKEHLDNGVMIHLHHEVVKWVMDSADPIVSGVKAVMYAGYDQGSHGLQEWKRREAFEPYVVHISFAEDT